MPRLGTMLLTVAALASLPVRSGEVALEVDTANVLRSGADRWIGINLNYIRDLDANRAPGARPLNEALKDMGVRWLRYPGGEKSDWHLFTEPPYEKPAPKSLGWYEKAAGKRMDFDAYIACCRAVNAEPFVVVPCDNEKRTGRTWDQWLEHAVAWVKYSNQVKKYGVKYWEIGNENWHNQTAPPAEMAKIVARFAKAMKEADPSIKIGASGSDGKWWQAFLPEAAPQLDFLVVSNYIGWDWKSYDYHPKHPSFNLLGSAGGALSALDKFAAPTDRQRLQVVVSETNAKDYAKNGWPDGNTIGHGLVAFEVFGRMMQQPRIGSAMLWTTRWMDDTKAGTSMWYGLGPGNEVMPAGYAVALWGRYLHADLVAVSGETDVLRGYASAGADKSELTVWIVNRAYEALSVTLKLKSPASCRTATVRRLAGKDADDTSPRWEELAPQNVTANALSAIAAPGLSITVVTLKQ